MTTSNNTKEKISCAGGPSSVSSREHKIEGDFTTNLNPNRTTFYVEKGRPYYGVYFTLDRIVPFTANDCFNDEVTHGHNVDLAKLELILKRCHAIENLKFFGVIITGQLITLVADNCPNLKNLELNSYEGNDEGNDDYESDDSDYESDYSHEIKYLVEKCKNLENFIIRNPPIILDNFDYDKVDRNYLFCSEKSDYYIYQFAHHNVNSSR